MGLVTEYSPWFLLICLLLGAAYATLLYYFDLRRGLKQLTHRVMFTLRLVSVSIIAFLLLGPLVRQISKIIEKPVVILGVDNSKSMVLTGDSTWYRSEFPEEIRQLTDALQKKCEVRVYSFSDRLTDGFDATGQGLKTDISAFFNEVETRYSNRNAAALILFSDGIYNEGTDPFYAARNVTYPVYSVALGDTVLKKDILVKKVVVNKTAYKGDKFPVEVLVEMDKCAGITTKLSLAQGSRVLETRDVKAGSDRALQKVSFMVEAKDVGIVRYSLQLSESEGEGNYQNNRAGFIVEVIDARQKIAIIYDSPHPDLSAIEKALEGSSHFETELIKTDNLPSNFEKYDLVILNQLPSVTSIANLGPLFKSRVSLLVIIGSLTDINTLNNLKPGLIINSSNLSFVESQPAVNEDFALFSLDKKDVALFRDFPPLQCPFGTYQYSPMSDVLVYQKINNITTRTPMIFFTRVADKKVGFIAGENIWRWRLSNYIQASSHEAFDLIIDKTAQYLSTRDDKSFFRIHLNARISENQPVEMDAEVFNASYELINDPDVNITITDEAQKSYPFIFSKTAKAYFLNAGLFPNGAYTYNASARVGNAIYQKSGKFFVEPVNVESSGLVADHNLLYRIASSHDGEMVGRADIGKLADKILSREDIRSVSISQQRMSDLVGNLWLFLLILGLLAAEWVIRKREGL